MIEDIHAFDAENGLTYIGENQYGIFVSLKDGEIKIRNYLIRPTKEVVAKTNEKTSYKDVLKDIYLTAKKSGNLMKGVMRLNLEKVIAKHYVTKVGDFTSADFDEMLADIERAKSPAAVAELLSR